MQTRKARTPTKAPREVSPEVKARWWWDADPPPEVPAVALWWELIRRNKEWQQRPAEILRAKGNIKAAREQIHQILKGRPANPISKKRYDAEGVQIAQLQKNIREKEMRIRRLSEGRNPFLEFCAERFDVNLTWAQLQRKHPKETQQMVEHSKREPCDLGGRSASHTFVRGFNFYFPVEVICGNGKKIKAKSVREKLQSRSKEWLIRWIERLHEQARGKRLFSVEHTAAPDTAARQLEALLRERKRAIEEDRAANTKGGQDRQPHNRNIRQGPWGWLKYWDCRHLLPKLTYDEMSSHFKGRESSRLCKGVKEIRVMIQKVFGG